MSACQIDRFLDIYFTFYDVLDEHSKMCLKTLIGYQRIWENDLISFNVGGP